jgi:hypothetical protein
MNEATLEATLEAQLAALVAQPLHLQSWERAAEALEEARALINRLQNPNDTLHLVPSLPAALERLVRAVPLGHESRLGEETTQAALRCLVAFGLATRSADEDERDVALAWMQHQVAAVLRWGTAAPDEDLNRKGFLTLVAPWAPQDRGGAAAAEPSSLEARLVANLVALCPPAHADAEIAAHALGAAGRDLEQLDAARAAQPSDPHLALELAALLFDITSALAPLVELAAERLPPDLSARSAALVRRALAVAEHLPLLHDRLETGPSPALAPAFARAAQGLFGGPLLPALDDVERVALWTAHPFALSAALVHHLRELTEEDLSLAAMRKVATGTQSLYAALAASPTLAQAALDRINTLLARSDLDVVLVRAAGCVVDTMERSGGEVTHASALSFLCGAVCLTRDAWEGSARSTCGLCARVAGLADSIASCSAVEEGACAQAVRLELFRRPWIRVAVARVFCDRDTPLLSDRLGAIRLLAWLHGCEPDTASLYEDAARIAAQAWHADGASTAAHVMHLAERKDYGDCESFLTALLLRLVIASCGGAREGAVERLCGDLVARLSPVEVLEVVEASCACGELVPNGQQFAHSLAQAAVAGAGAPHLQLWLSNLFNDN